jgi:phosphonate transport system substrate-binding protein
MKQLLATGLLAATIAFAAPVLAQDTIRFAVTDLDGLEELQQNMGPFKDAFEAASGLKVEFFPVSGRTVAVEAMAADQVDFVLTGPAEYVVFNGRLKAQPVVVWTRPNYRSSLIVSADSPVKTLAQVVKRSAASACLTVSNTGHSCARWFGPSRLFRPMRCTEA